MDLTILNFSKLLEIYSVSNTANYLFRHYKSDMSVIDFSTRYDSSQLVSLINEIIGKEIKTVEDIIYSYAALVALSYRPSSEAVSAMDKVDLTNLRWAKKLWDICRSSYVSTVLLKLDLAQKKGRLESSIASSNASTSTASSSFEKPVSQVMLLTRGNVVSTIHKVGDMHD